MTESIEHRRVVYRLFSGSRGRARKLAAIAIIGLLALGACGGGGGSGPPATQPPPDPMPEPGPNDPERPPQTSSDPSFHLGTARFTTHQPRVLEQIGAHHAYARGLTGRGMRIGIQDTIVDYTQTAEFGSRVRLLAADGAKLYYNRPFGDDPGSDIEACVWFGTCDTWEGDSEGDDEAYNRWVVRDIVSEVGWPTRDDSAFFVDEHYSEGSGLGLLYRWREVPTPYGEGAHGTVVASVAAGKNLGVAPQATIIPIAENLTDDQGADFYASDVLQRVIASLPTMERRQADEGFASAWREHYGNFDIINRSFGTPFFDSDIIFSELDATLRWYRSYMPNTLDAFFQIGTPDNQKTILVYAAGNEGQSYSGVEADLPYYVPGLRGHSLAVVATDPRTGALANYSNRCGYLPSNWNAARHGPHYCLAAPGTVRGLVPNPYSPGRGDSAGGLNVVKRGKLTPYWG